MKFKHLSLLELKKLNKLLKGAKALIDLNKTRGKTKKVIANIEKNLHT
jgi:hypothetical protein